VGFNPLYSLAHFINRNVSYSNDSEGVPLLGNLVFFGSPPVTLVSYTNDFIQLTLLVLLNYFCM